MFRKKGVLLTLLICMIIAFAVSVLFSINQRHSDRVIASFVAAMENAKAAFSDYQETGSGTSYKNGVAAINDAVQIVLTEGERLDIYQERQTLLASCNILSAHPRSVDENISMLLSAINQIIKEPQKRVSYGKLLDFYNTINHTTDREDTNPK